MKKNSITEFRPLKISTKAAKKKNRPDSLVNENPEAAFDLEQLKSSEIRYRTLFHSSRNGIFILDGETGKILDVNKYFEDFFGIPHADCCGKELWEINIFRNREDYLKALTELKKKGYLYNDDLLLKTSAGKIIHAEIDISAYSENNVPVLYAILRDISERSKVLDRLRKNEALLIEQLNAKDRFLSIIAHDLKTPFNSIIGFSNLLAEKVRSKDYDDIEEYAGIIQESSWKAVDLLNNLLEWSRFVTGKMDFNPRELKMNNIIIESLSILKEIAARKSINVELKVSEDAKVFGDRLMINSILRNLITNSVKFTNPGGKIIIKGYHNDSGSFISVSDTGIGMHEEEIEAIFGSEGKISRKGTMGEEGTGMGLSLCRDLVGKHSGDLRVESFPGKGTTITVKFPLKS